jgi:hypothetical protein
MAAPVPLTLRPKVRPLKDINVRAAFKGAGSVDSPAKKLSEVQRMDLNLYAKKLLF